MTRRGGATRLAARVLPAGCALLVWGPPRLRSGGRSLTEALDDPTSSLDAGAVLQIGAWALAAGVVGVLLAWHVAQRTGYLDRLLRGPAVVAYVAYGCLALLSVAWSPAPLYTLFFAAKLPIALVALDLLVEHDARKRAQLPLYVLVAVAAAQALVILALYVVDPQLVGEGSVLFLDYRLYGGVLPDYGSSALLVGMALLTVAVHHPDELRRRFALAGYGVSVLVLFASLTRSAIAAGAVMAVIVCWQRRVARSVLVLAGAAVAGLGASVLSDQIGAVLGIATRFGIGITTLSGRTLAFDYLLDAWRTSPWIGLGYGAGTRAALVRFVEESGLGIGAAHDVVSKALVDLGVAGAVLLAITYVGVTALLLRLWRRSRRVPTLRPLVAQLTCLHAWVTISCTVGESFAGAFPPFFVLLVCARRIDAQLEARTAAPGLRPPSRRVAGRPAGTRSAAPAPVPASP